jgi:hypothetical protein
MLKPIPGRRVGKCVVVASITILAACSTTASSRPAPSVEPTPTAPAATVDVGSHSPASSVASNASGLSGDPLHAIALTDVRSGEEFSIGRLAAEKPLLLEPMAIWCSNCRAQQREVVAAHGLADFHSVSLDIDPGELPAELADYAEREGFDWRFAMSDADLVRSLRERFGSAAIFPTAMPKILFRVDGSVELIGLGEQLGPEELAAIIGG